MARTQEQATWGSVFLTMTMTVFSGTFVSVGETGVLAFLSKLTLNKYAIDGIHGIISGNAGLAGQGPEAAIPGRHRRHRLHSGPGSLPYGLAGRVVA